jgi:hypothetical protein
MSSTRVKLWQQRLRAQGGRCVRYESVCRVASIRRLRTQMSQGTTWLPPSLTLPPPTPTQPSASTHFQRGKTAVAIVPAGEVLPAILHAMGGQPALPDGLIILTHSWLDAFVDAQNQQQQHLLQQRQRAGAVTRGGSGGGGGGKKKGGKAAAAAAAAQPPTAPTKLPSFQACVYLLSAPPTLPA